MSVQIKKETIQFLKDLSQNNNREWFNSNKEKFILANENFIAFVQSLIDEVAKFDKSISGIDAKHTVFRIYRDTRFSKDKTPYKTHFAATLMGKDSSCGIAGYYFHLEPGNSFLAGGVHMTEPVIMKSIREEISREGKSFLKIINDKKFRENFILKGEQSSRVPQGFDKEDEMAEYLKYKELMIHHKVNDKELFSHDFVAYCAKVCKNMIPFNQFVNKPVLQSK
jgi:uncharacterized protein (TIGR02453 family)